MTEGDTMETLKRRRANYKGQVTSFNKFIERIAASTSPLSPVEVGELQLRINTFESLLSKYDDVQTEIECAADDVEAQSNEREEFENSYYKALAVANNLLAEFDKLLKLDFKSVAGSERGNKQNLVKLPTIQLPKFNGSYENWLHFRDTFSSLIDSVDNIDDINKFHYLRASLEGSAAVVVQSIEFSAKNYSVAWKLLKERYDNKRLLTNNHVSALFNIEPITRESSLSIKRLIDNLNKNLSALESLGEPVKSWDTLLIYILVQKLDSKTFREWEGFKGRQSNTESITLDKFISFLRSHADLLETLEFSRNPPQSQSISAPKGSNPKIKTMVSVQKTDTHETCPKCNGAHPLAKCSQFLALTNEARLKLLPQLKICFNCFSGKHFANRCMKPGCKLCKRKHNVLVHVADYKYTPGASNDDSSTSRSDNETKSGTAPHNAAPSNPDVVFSASATSSAHGGCRQVLLSTALVKLYDNEHREHLARALLDNGSTGCLLTERMLSKLNLPTKKVNKTVLGVNGVLSHVKKECHVKLKSLNEDYSTVLQCSVLPTVTDDVPCRPLDISNLHIPSDVCLADPDFHTPGSVDLVISAEMFWSMLGSHKIELGEGNPVLRDTQLGWLVTGSLPYDDNEDYPVRCNFSKVDIVQNLLPRFWQLEEVSPHFSEYSTEERLCEEHFVKHTTRQEDGKFCVRIPLTFLYPRVGL
ncbi:putative peptidase (DUF1758) domain-containing protein [Phthorimaea operculella]|nr:putative peptidase (DUF1758) domain-containing protein [Phthorimaea operculella]